MTRQSETEDEILEEERQKLFDSLDALVKKWDIIKVDMKEREEQIKNIQMETAKVAKEVTILIEDTQNLRQQINDMDSILNK